MSNGIFDLDTFRSKNIEIFFWLKKKFILLFFDWKRSLFCYCFYEVTRNKIICFVNTSNVFYFDGNIPLELRTKWPWDSLTFTRRMKQIICKFEKTANHCFLSDPSLFIALPCQSSLCVYPHCKVSIGRYTKMCTSPLIFLQLNSHDKYLKKIFEHFHFHCIFDHLNHEQS